MKSLTLTVLIALGLLTACGPTTKKTEDLGTTKQVSRTTSVPDPLTAEQQKHDADVIAAVTKTATNQQDNDILPTWVAEQYRALEAQGYTKEHVAFQRSFGWGTGTFAGKRFLWFAHTNTDAWLQFNFSVKLDEKTQGEAVLHKDGYGHPWEMEWDNDGPSYGGLPGTATWMGVTNSWTDAHCTIYVNFCDTANALDETVAEVNKALKLNMVVRGKFPWETLATIKEMQKTEK